MSALDHALAYARLGWRVLPCERGEKRPILKDWPARATTDAETIQRWWRRAPEANVAIATGAGSSIFVLDVDGPEGERVLADLERHHGPLPDLYVCQFTGSGYGWQAFFAWPDGREIRNSAGRLGSKLDTRGEGGYVVLPPSEHPSGGIYAWAADREPWTLPPETAPGWLVDLLDPPPAPEPERRPWNDNVVRLNDQYVERAVAAELALVASAPEGRRNSQLNESAFNLFRFAAEGRLGAGSIANGLEQAARHAGLAPKEIASTMRSAAAKRGVRI